MLKQLRYFQAVVEQKSFSKAADECYISQSAISQQIQALERDIGVKLLKREGRGFSVTPAGDLFYRKSCALTKEWETLVNEVREAAGKGNAVLRLGCLRSYTGPEFRQAVAAFCARYPQAQLQLYSGNHEELYERLISGKVDLVLSDQRRAFSGNYYNEILASRPYQAEMISRSPAALSEHFDLNDLQDFPCILISSEDQQEQEADYYRSSIGIQSGFLFAPNLEEGRLLASSGRGYLLLEGSREVFSGSDLCRMPILQNGQPLLHNYCAFWNRSSHDPLTKEFADLLKEQFTEEQIQI